jgi:hypothetical protein
MVFDAGINPQSNGVSTELLTTTHVKFPPLTILKYAPYVDTTSNLSIKPEYQCPVVVTLGNDVNAQREVNIFLSETPKSTLFAVLFPMPATGFIPTAEYAEAVVDPVVNAATPNELYKFDDDDIEPPPKVIELKLIKLVVPETM